MPYVAPEMAYFTDTFLDTINHDVIPQIEDSWYIDEDCTDSWSATETDPGGAEYDLNGLEEGETDFHLEWEFLFAEYSNFDDHEDQFPTMESLRAELEKSIEDLDNHMESVSIGSESGLYSASVSGSYKASVVEIEGGFKVVMDLTYESMGVEK